MRAPSRFKLLGSESSGFTNKYRYKELTPPSHEVENNFIFLVNFYATFAADGVPPMSHFQASQYCMICVSLQVNLVALVVISLLEYLVHLMQNLVRLWFRNCGWNSSNQVIFCPYIRCRPAS